MNKEQNTIIQWSRLEKEQNRVSRNGKYKLKLYG